MLKKKKDNPQILLNKFESGRSILLQYISSGIFLHALYALGFMRIFL